MGLTEWWRRIRDPGGGSSGGDGSGERTGTGAPPGADDPGRTVTCGLCARRFIEDRGQPVCRACPLARACRYVRCPRCGYENPVKPEWMDRLRGRSGGVRRESAGRRRGS